MFTYKCTCFCIKRAEQSINCNLKMKFFKIAKSVVKGTMFIFFNTLLAKGRETLLPCGLHMPRRCLALRMGVGVDEEKQLLKCHTTLWSSQNHCANSAGMITNNDLNFLDILNRVVDQLIGVQFMFVQFITILLRTFVIHIWFSWINILLWLMVLATNFWLFNI